MKGKKNIAVDCEALILLLSTKLLPKLLKYKLEKELLLLKGCCLHHHYNLLRFEIVR